MKLGPPSGAFLQWAESELGLKPPAPHPLSEYWERYADERCWTAAQREQHAIWRQGLRDLRESSGGSP